MRAGHYIPFIFIWATILCFISMVDSKTINRLPKAHVSLQKRSSNTPHLPPPSQIIPDDESEYANYEYIVRGRRILRIWPQDDLPTLLRADVLGLVDDLMENADDEVDLESRQTFQRVHNNAEVVVFNNRPDGYEVPNGVVARWVLEALAHLGPDGAEDVQAGHVDEVIREGETSDEDVIGIVIRLRVHEDLPPYEPFEPPLPPYSPPNESLSYLLPPPPYTPWWAVSENDRDSNDDTGRGGEGLRKRTPLSENDVSNLQTRSAHRRTTEQIKSSKPGSDSPRSFHPLQCEELAPGWVGVPINRLGTSMGLNLSVWEDFVYMGHEFHVNSTLEEASSCSNASDSVKWDVISRLLLRKNTVTAAEIDDVQRVSKAHEECGCYGSISNAGTKRHQKRLTPDRGAAKSFESRRDHPISREQARTLVDSYGSYLRARLPGNWQSVCEDAGCLSWSSKFGNNKPPTKDEAYSYLWYFWRYGSWSWYYFWTQGQSCIFRHAIFGHTKMAVCISDRPRGCRQ